VHKVVLRRVKEGEVVGSGPNPNPSSNPNPNPNPSMRVLVGFIGRAPRNGGPSELRPLGSGPPFRRVRHSESRHSWSLQEIVLDIATTRRLTLTLTLTVSLTVSCQLVTAGNG